MNIETKIHEHIFRGYDIRGIYGKDLFDETAYLIGRGYGTYLKKYIGNDTVIVGYDNRASSPKLSENLINGIISTGINVIDIGLATTPMLYYANEKFNIYAGIMITASHNPKDYNGFKIAYDKRGPICGEEIQELKRFILEGKFIDGVGSIQKKDIKADYIKMFTSIFKFKKHHKVIIDSGNGTASVIVKDIFSQFENLDVEYIYCDSNPEFPNHHPDPAEPENMVDLQSKVKEARADIGIAFDGDCDRAGCVDHKGNVVPSDSYIAIMSRYILPKVENKSVIFDVSCSKSLADEIRKSGGEPYVYKTGDPYIKREMLKKGILFGGEISGHIFFKDKFYGADDGIYVALRMLELLDNETQTLASMQESLNKYYSTPVLKIQVTEENKSKIVDDVKKYCIDRGYNTSTIDGARVEFEDSFAIIRMSNTSPKITVRFEATTNKRLEELKKEFMDLLDEIIKKYS